MEDLWKLREIGFRLNDVADRAEYDRLLRRYREEETRSHLDNLLYRGQAVFGAAPPDAEKK